jgi:hypothetical protein
MLTPETAHDFGKPIPVPVFQPKDKLPQEALIRTKAVSSFKCQGNMPALQTAAFRRNEGP